MFKYNYFGLKLSSPVELDSIPALNFSTLDDDITISFGSVPSSLYRPAFLSDQLEIDKTRAALFHEAEIKTPYVPGGPNKKCLVTDGSKIIFEDRNHADARWIQFLLVTFVASAILHQRAMFALYGSTVLHKGRAVTIIGPSGCGKSTLTAKLVQSGGTLISEDVSVVRMIGGLPYVLLGPQGIKLFPEIIQILNIGKVHEFVAPNHKKLLWRQPKTELPSMVRLSNIILLDIERQNEPRGMFPLSTIPLGAVFGVDIGYQMGRLEMLCEQLRMIGPFISLCRLRRSQNLENLDIAVGLLTDWLCSAPNN